MAENDREAGATPRRAYDSPLRRERAAQTRDRILAAASEVVRGFTTWDWQGLTYRAVAERAGISERTVYRHFATERDLHEAVMRKLEEEAGVSYQGLELQDFAAVTARSFATLSSFAVTHWPDIHPQDQPALASEAARRHEALVHAIGAETDDWTDTQRQMAAGMLDVLWNVPSLDRLITEWKLDGNEATQALTWVIGLVVEAIRDGRRPGTTPESN